MGDLDDSLTPMQWLPHLSSEVSKIPSPIKPAKVTFASQRQEKV
jgi:hypothetical protein